MDVHEAEGNRSGSAHCVHFSTPNSLVECGYSIDHGLKIFGARADVAGNGFLSVAIVLAHKVANVPQAEVNEAIVTNHFPLDLIKLGD
jgi:hypothetical protein